MNITDVLGRVRPIDKLYQDGSWNCPFCCAAVPVDRACVGYVGGCSHGTHCPNPACIANPHYPVARAQQDIARAAERAREEQERKAVQEFRQKYAEDRARDERQRRIDVEDDARSRGCCVRCAVRELPYRAPRFIKHRKACPHAV